jgi:hypothetical protein
VRSPKYSSAPKSLSLYSPSLDIPDDVNERRSFFYFRSRTVPDISGCFESEFWDGLIPQVSQAEPAVRHALLALSSLYEAYEFNGKPHRDLNCNLAERLTRFALHQYTKAVGLLADRLSTDQPSFQAILISCLIFVWIEFLQHNLDTALRHLQSGLQILKDLQQSSDQPRIDASLPRLFTRLHTQARLHGSPTSNFNSSTSEKHLKVLNIVPCAFSSILEARNCLDAELDSIYRFMRRMYKPEFVSATIKNHPFPDPLSLEAIVHHHLQNLCLWQTAFQNSPSVSSQPPDAKHAAGIDLLQIQHASVSIMLKTLLEVSEMVFDQLTSKFERILTLAERLIQNTRSRGILVLSFDIGVLAPLFLVALKCREPIIRRKAIALLKRAPEREGIWYRDSVVEFAELKFEMEERGRGSLAKTSPLPVSARMHSEHFREVVVDGKRVTVLRFKRGPADRTLDGGFEEEITTLTPAMGELL